MDNEQKEMELLKAKIDYIKTYVMPSLSIVLVTFLFFVQLDQSKKWSIDFWVSILIMITFSLLASHMSIKHAKRQKQLINLLSKNN